MEWVAFVEKLQSWSKEQGFGKEFLEKKLPVEKGYYSNESPFFALSKKLHDHFGEPRRTWERWLICFTKSPCVPVNLDHFGRRCHFSLNQQEAALSFLEKAGALIVLPHLEKIFERKVYFRDPFLVDQVIEEKGARFESIVVSAVSQLCPESVCYFWQNSKKQEVDLVVEKEGVVYLALECKASDKISFLVKV